MKLATKLVSLLMLPILLVIAVDGYVTMRAEVRRFEADEREDVTEFAASLRQVMIEVDHASGYARVQELVREVSTLGRDIHVRWVWFDASAAVEQRPIMTVDREQIVQDEDGVSFWDSDMLEEDSLLAYVHIPVAGAGAGGLELQCNATDLHDLHRALTIRAWRVAGILMLCGGAAVFFGSRFVAGPLDRLIEKTRRVGRGELDPPLDMQGRDELSELGRAIDAMCADLARSRQRLAEETEQRLDATAQLRHADRLRTVGRLASGIAHELGTPLAVVSGRADMIASGRIAESEVRENASVIRQQSDRIAGIIRQLLDFARRGTPQRREADLADLARQTIDLLQSAARKRQAIMLVEAAEPVVALVDPAQIQQVLTNLLMNAMHAMPDGGEITVRLREAISRRPDHHEADESRYIRIDVEDEGGGIAEDDLERVFDPFFTTKDVGEGTGMGLSVADGIVRDHGGWIAASSVVGQGSCFSVFLPKEHDA